MANKTPVHVLSREGGWAVVREGNDRATSLHPTQAEASKAGREIARKDGTAFLLHAKDGRVRERSDYGENPARSPARPEDDPASPVAATVTAATRATGGAVDLASGVVGGAIEGLGGETQGAVQAGETPGERIDATEEAGDLAYEERYAEYEVYDRRGETLGKVDTLLLDEGDELEYVGVKTSPLGTRSTLIPIRIARIDDERRAIEVAADKEHIETGPAFEDEQEITPEVERQLHGHYGLEYTTGAKDRTAYADYHTDTHQQTPTTPGSSDLGMATGGTASGGLSEHDRRGESGRESLSRPESNPAAEEEIRVQRSEEELRVGTTKRKAGALHVRKRVRVERERLEVPVRRDEVHIERVPVSREASEAEAEIGEDEVVVPVVEEEVVVSKRPVVKEEIRIRKDVVEDTEVVEEDVRREEVDVEDQTTRRDA